MSPSGIIPHSPRIEIGILNAEIAHKLFEQIRKQAYAEHLLSWDHFSVEGTLIDASASMKSFVLKLEFRGGKDDDTGGSGGRNEEVDFKKERRSNKTHESTTDPDARLFRKSKGSPSRLCMMGHIITENRNGLIVQARLTEANTCQEWDAGLEMIDQLSMRPGQTIGADKGYDTKRFVDVCRERSITPHVAAKVSRGAVDGRTTSTVGYAVSQRKRKRVEEPFGWMKEVGTIR